MSAKRTSKPAKPAKPAKRKVASARPAKPAKRKVTSAKPAKTPPPWTARGAQVAQKEQRAKTRGLSVDEVAARVVATGLVERVYRLPWGAIGGPGDYAAIAAALRDLAQPAFPLVAIVDAVDLAGEQASLELSLDGVYHVLDASVNGAEVDDGVLVMLGALFEQRQHAAPPEARRWLFVDPITAKTAKTYLVICVTFEAMSAINEAVGTGFIKLTEL